MQSERRTEAKTLWTLGRLSMTVATSESVPQWHIGEGFGAIGIKPRMEMSGFMVRSKKSPRPS